MPTGVYDDEKQDQGQRSVTPEALRGFEENMAGSKASKLANKMNRSAGGTDKNTASPENLLGAEKGVGGKNPISKKGSGGGKGDLLMNGLAGKAKGFVQKHRKKLLIAGVAGAGVIPLIGMLLFFIGLMGLPNYAENIAARQLAKLTRAAATSTNNVMREKHAIASMTDQDYTAAKSKYANLTKKTFEYTDRFRPNKVLQSVQGQDSSPVQYHYEKTAVLKRDRLVAISFSNDGGKTTERITLSNPGFFESRIHPVQTLQARLDTTRALTRAINTTLKVNDPKVPTVVRAIAVKNFMKTHGISLKGIVAAKYLGKDQAEARAQIQKDSYEHNKDKVARTPFTQADLKEGLTEAQTAQDECVADPKCLAETVTEASEAPEKVTETIEKRFDPKRVNVPNAIIGGINPIYDIALPVCLVYDGSRLSSDSIDKRSDEAQRTSSLVMSTADQQREGNSINGEAVGAMNWKLGDTHASNAIRSNSGQSVNTLANTASTQSSPFGGYSEVTIFNVLLDNVDKGTADALNGFASSTCSVATDPLVGVAVGAGNLIVTGILSFFTGGGAAAGQQVATQSAKIAAQKGLSNVVKKVTQNLTKEGMKKLGKYAYKEVQFWGAVEIATYLSRLLVGMHAVSGNGLAVGEGFANDADNGANQLGNNMMRTNYGGRPLTNAETTESIAEDNRVSAQWNSEKSTFDRYFAVDNPNSMLTKVGMTLNSNLNTNFASNALPKVSSIFNPFTALPKLFGSLNNKVAFAAEANVANQVYGNVQAGWTKAELDLIDKNASYSSPSENEFQLDARGDRAEIEETYGPCFNDTMGKMIGDKWIERNNETGDVSTDKGKCSPKELGPTNPKYGDGVFRYRLFLFYNGTISTLGGIDSPAEPSTTNNPTAPSGGTGAVPQGTAQELAKKILASPNISFQVEPVQRQAMQRIADTGRAAQCGGPAIDPKLLGVLLAISEKYKIVIGVLVDGHVCSTAGFNEHPKGKAVDLNGVNPLTGGGGTGRFITWAPGEMGILKPFYDDMGALVKSVGGGGIGQRYCFKNGVKPVEATGVRYFEDTCHHLHVEVD